MIEESKCCSEMMKKHFKKTLVMTKNDKEVSENSTKCCICNNTYLSGHVKVRYDCHITGKNRGLIYRDCNINFKLNQ